MSENTNNTAALSEVTAAADQATEVGGVLESALPTTTADQVAHIRALNTQGESVNITKEESQNLILSDDAKTRVQTLAGMDYSLLTEQIVPGEFWLDINGVKKQVYTCTFKAVWTLPAIGVWDGLEEVVASDVIDCFGFLCVDGTRMSLTNPVYGIEFQMIFTNGKMSSQIRATSATYAGKAYTYVIAIKYLK